MSFDLEYNGTTLTWSGHGSYKATSGMLGHQVPKDQCLPDEGPVPEGRYYVPLILGGAAKDDGSGRCNLSPSWQIQSIPRGKAAGACEPYWANWGHNRVRFEPADAATKNACRPRRSGFYLHDSVKGFSHGCIEVDGRFFSQLRSFVKKSKKRRLDFKIKYTTAGTYGGTKSP